MTKKYIIYCLFLFVFSLGLSGVSFAVPASPGISEVVQPDGTVINVKIKGDEWNNRIETVDGYVIAKAATGIWHHVSRYDGNTPVLSPTPAHELPAPAIQRHIKPLPDFTRPNPNAGLSPSSSVNGVSSPMAAPDMVINTGTFNGKILFLLAEFTDRTGTYSEASFASFISNNISDYFNKASYGKVTLQPAVESYGTSDNGVIGWVNLGYAHPNTGDNTGSLNQQLTKDAIIAADPYINYASFDTNGDGYADASELAIVVIVAGYERAYDSNSPAVWGHKWSIASPPNVDGVIVGSYHNGAGGYAQFGEIQGNHQATMGVMVHELGHLIFRLPDLYDTDQSSEGIGEWSLMASGSWGMSNSNNYWGETPVLPDAWSKYKLGWVDGTIGSGSTSIVAAGSTLATSTNSVYKLATISSNEYFLVENRQPLGYDRGLEMIGSSVGGLAIWHIDDSKTSNNTECYPPNNCTTNHYMVALEQADGLWNLEKNHNRGDTGDLFPGSSNNPSFTNNSTPNSKFYGGGASNVSVSSISAPSSTMTALLVGQTMATLSVSKVGAGNGTIISTPPGIDCGMNCSTSFINGTPVTLTAIPLGNSLFDGWSGDCYGTALSTSVTMNSNKVCTATFILGLAGEYYHNSDLTGLGLIRTDPLINFDWGFGSPDPAIYADTFSVRWTGKLLVDYDESYTFSAVTDDGVRLWIDGYLVLDYWQTGGVSLNNTMSLTAGLHDIKVEFFEDTGAALAQLYWSSPSTSYGIIPNDHLYPPNGAGSSPVLEWAGGAGFTVDGVEPQTGDTTTMFTYRMKYTDPDWNPPMSGFPRVHVLKGGVEISGSPFSMSYESGDFTGGVIYRFSTTLTAGDDYTYYFDAVDNTGRQAIATPVKPTPTAPIDAPDSELQGFSAVTNGGFETGTSPWVFYTNGAGTFANDAIGVGSTLAAHIAITTAGTNVQMNQSGLVLEANTQYRLSFKAYSNTGHDVSVSLQKHVSPYTNYGLSGRVFNLSTSWQTFTAEFTTTGFTGIVNDGRLMFWLAPYDASGDHYYFDDVVLEKVVVTIGPPEIITQPANQTVVVGYTATFSVVASGTVPLSYQWQKNGVDIAGATGEKYMTPATVIGDGGATFRCIVTNTYGSVTSNSAVLHVNGSWTSVGPYGGYVESLAISPAYATDQTLFAVTYRIFKSTDGGGSWRGIKTGFGNAEVRSLAISPAYADDQTIFAGTNGGVFKSTNGGDSWSAVNTGMGNIGVLSLSISPSYADDQTIFAGTNGGVFKSTNGGDSWSAVNTGMGDMGVMSLVISPFYADDQTLFAGTNGGVFKSTNGGDNWSVVNSAAIESFSISPAYATDQTIFARTWEGVLKSVNGGVSWSAANTGLGNIWVFSLSISPAYAIDQTLFAGTILGVFKSTNGGGSWSDVDSGLGDTIEVRSLSISPAYATDQTIFAGTYYYGVYKSMNGGVSWSEVNTGLNNLSVLSFSISPSYATDQTIFAGTQGDVFKSTNGGVTWSEVNTGLSILYGVSSFFSGYGLSSLAISPAYGIDQTLFVGVENGGVFKSTNGGVSWSEVNAGLSSLGVVSLPISPAYAIDQTIFAVTSGVIFMSTNGGGSWNEVDTGLGNLDVRSLSISPNYAIDQTLFAGTYYDGVFKSTDRGVSWSEVNTGLSNLRVSSLSISPNYATDQTIFAGTGSGVYKSTNGGVSWSEVNTGLSNLLVFTLSISSSYAIDETLFAGTWGNGVFKSESGGMNWSKVNTGLTDLYIRSLSISPNYADDGILFAGTSYSAWKYSEVALGGFESGTTPWVFYTDGAATFLTDVPGDGSPNAGHITIQTPGANVQMYQTGLELEANTRYRLSFKAYSNTGHDVSVSLMKHFAPYTNYGLSGRVFDLMTAWQTFAVEFTTTGFTGTVNDSRLMFWLASYDESGDEYFFDDILLEKVAPPLITGQPSDQTVDDGRTATFRVVASGLQPLIYQWQKNGVNIPGATGAAYTTPPTIFADSGTTYRCVISNILGNVTSNSATLIVNPSPPAITTEPADQTIVVGYTATFSVVASGTAPLSYQWQKDGVDIPGATSDIYMTPATVIEDSGTTFRCIVTNAYGSAMSDPATLNVNGSWTSVGPDGGNTTSLIVSPNYATDQTIFAGTQGGGVFKSTNGGGSWSVVNTGLSNLSIEALSISPNYENDKTLFVGTWGGGVFKSMDGGKNWSAINTGLSNLTVLSFSISPAYATDQTIFVRTSGNGGIFKSTNGGGSWSAVNTGLSNLTVSSLSISPNYATDQTIFAGIHGNGVLKSTDGGGSWGAVSTGLGNQYIYSLSISPNYATDQTIFAGSFGGGIFKSTNGGGSWSAVNLGLSNQNVWSLSISPDYATDQTIFAGMWDNGGGIFKSTNGGGSWSAVNTGLSSLYVSSLSISPAYATDQTIFAGTYYTGGGILKSTNGGGSWSVVNTGLSNLTVLSLSISPDYATDQTIFAGTSFAGVFKSTNGGESWSAVNTGLSNLTVLSLSISPAYAVDQTIFFAGEYPVTYWGPDGFYSINESGVYKSTDGGVSWNEVIHLGWTIYDYLSSLAISPNYAIDQTIFAGYSNGSWEQGGIYKSTNGGESWIDTFTGLDNFVPSPNVSSLAISPNYAIDQTLFAGTQRHGVFKSTDGGESWNPVSTVAWPDDIVRLTISPNYATDQTLFAVYFDYSSYYEEVYKSTNGGESWSPVNTGLADQNVSVLSLSQNYAVDQILFAGTSSGVYKSTNGGESWSAIDTGLGNLNVYSLSISPHYANDGILFAGTEGSSVWKYSEFALGGFESGTTPWVFYTDGAGTFSTDAPGDGSPNAGHITIHTPGTDVQMYQTGLELEANTRYRLSFKAYSNTGHHISVSLLKHFAPYTNYGLSGRVFELANVWQTFTVEFTTTGFTEMVNDGKLMFSLSPYAESGDEYFFDDIVLEKVNPPVITSQPSDQSVVEGQTATFNVAAEGAVPLSYQWQKNGVDISGATDTVYTTPPTIFAESGTTYRCVVSNTAGSVTSNSATLTVNAIPPSITIQPADQTVVDGQTATFSVSAAGTVPLSYQWHKNSVDISGATGAVYTTPPTIIAESGATYRCVVSNTAGSVTSNSATLTVNAIPPAIATQPVNQTVVVGQTATFSVSATGTAPLSYQWQKSGVNISGATSAVYTTPTTVLADSGATYRCVVSNTAGSVASSAATLTVTNTTVVSAVLNGGFETGTSPWVFYTNGAGTFANDAAGDGSAHAAHIKITTAGTNVQMNQAGVVLEANTLYRLSFKAYSNTGHDVSVSLQKNVSPYTNYGLSSRVFNLTTAWQAFTVEFTTTGFTETVNDGRLMFWLAAYDAAGDHYYFDDVVLEKVIVAIAPPEITTHPADKTVVVGYTATFIVVATGTAPLSYQWQKNGVNIPGATSDTYMTPSTVIGDSGATFRCIVTNAYGSATSNEATLHVNGSWTPVGPDGGSAKSLAISPNYATDQTIFVATQGNIGIFKSANGGGSWSAVNTGLDRLPVLSLSISPNYATDETIFAVTDGMGVFKSTNGGGSWSAVNAGLDSLPVLSLSISPNYATDQTIFAGTYMGGVYKSTTGGVSWIAVNTGLNNQIVRSLSISPAFGADQTIFAGTDYGGSIFKSTDGGGNWTVVNLGLGTQYVSALSISPNYATDQTIFAMTHSGVYRSQNGGMSWSAVNSSSVTSLSFSPAYATDQTLFAGVCCTFPGGGVFKSTNGGVSWSEVNTGLGSLDILSFAISPNYSIDQIIFAGTGRDGVFKSANGGVTWSEVNTGLSNLYVSALSVSPNYATDRTIFVWTDGGIFKSTTGGESWNAVSIGLGNQYVSALSISPNYATDQTLFVGTDNRGVYKSTNGGESWGSVNAELGYIIDLVVSLSISPNYAADQTLFAGTSNDGIYKTTDGGESWSAVNTGLGDINDLYFMSLSISPNYATDQTIFAGSYNDNGGVFKSTDGGVSWSAVNTGLSNLFVSSLSISPNYATDQTIFVWICDSTNNRGGIYKSTDGGGSWSVVNTGLNDLFGGALSISPNYATNQTIFAGTYLGGVYKSTTGGGSWRVVNSGFIPGILSLSISPSYSYDGILFAGTSSSSVWKYSEVALGGFESGTTPWLFYTDGAGTFLTDAPGEGSPNAGHITIGTPGSNVQMYQTGLELEANTQYRLTFKAYSNTGHDVSVSLLKHFAPYTNYGLSGRVFDLTTAWQEFSIEFTTSGFAGTVNDGRLMFWLASYVESGDEYFFDDIVFEKLGTAPTIISQPSSQTVIEGQTASFNVVATGTAPLNYQWQKNGVDIPGATGADYTTPPTAIADNGTTYRCIVSNAVGSVTSSEATLMVTSMVVSAVLNGGFEEGTSPWVFYTNGAGTFANDVAGEGSARAAHIKITTAGTNVQMKQAGLALDANTQYRLSFKAYSNTGHDISVSLQKNLSPYTGYGLSGRVFNLTTVWQAFTVEFTTTGFTGTVNDGRLMFWLAPYDAVGDHYYFDDVVLEKVTAAVVPPTITTQPANQTVAVGQTAAFTVAATGTAPLSYQWQISGVDIPGATSATYSTPATVVGDSGTAFRCIVTNAYGSATSNTATLTVTNSVPVSVVTNGGFEAGTTPWVFYTNGAGTFANDAAGDGSAHAAHIKITTPGTNVQMNQAGLVLEPNTQYRLSFKAYSNTGHDVSVTLQKNVSPYTGYGLSGRVFNLTTAWQGFTVEFTTTGFTGTVNDGRLMFWLAPYDASGDHYYFDDVALEKIGTP